MDLSELRRQYIGRGLDESNLLDDPIELLRLWFGEAAETSPEPWLEPNVMSLATSDRAGYVSDRIVLLKGIEQGALVFFTNYRSRKGRQLEENPSAAATLYWPQLVRQVRAEGRVEKTDRQQTVRYFHSRPRGSQLAAVVSQQSQPVQNRQELEAAVAQLARELDGRPVPVPEDWGGYRLLPHRMEFWQGRENRLHDRFEYLRDSSNEPWLIRRLAP